MFTELLTVENLVALLTLTALEIVLGIDNIILIAILSAKLPEKRQALARRIGLSLAMIMRVGLLLALAWIMGLTDPLFTLFGHAFSGRDLILIAGGLFLVGKATFEVHENLEGPAHASGGKRAFASFSGVITQILLLDLVFSLDSVITAVGMAKEIPIMIAAVILAVAFMLFAAGFISRFIERHPTIKILALSFMLLVGVILIVDGFGKHIERAYLYFAMGFSLTVEMLNLRMRSKRRRAAAVDDEAADHVQLRRYDPKELDAAAGEKQT